MLLRSSSSEPNDDDVNDDEPLVITMTAVMAMGRMRLHSMFKVYQLVCHLCASSLYFSSSLTGLSSAISR